MDTTPSINDAMLPAELSHQQIELIREKTPPIMRKKVRKGGGSYDYVPVGWILDRLNMIFSNRWTFEVLRENVSDDGVWVLGRLQVMLGNGIVIRKENFGGAEVKRYGKDHKNAGRALSLANDLKSASADALKKCASMLGICLDVYAPVLDEYYELEDVEEKMTEEELKTLKAWENSIQAAPTKADLVNVGKDIAKLKINAAQRQALEEAFMARLSALEHAKA